MKKRIKLISGAQTGADRAALDLARLHGLPYAGWVPHGRRAEDGRIADCYENLSETPGPDYETRTEWNVRDSDATLILSHGNLEGGSLFTLKSTEKLQKPCLHIDLEKNGMDRSLTRTISWLKKIQPESLNIAGPRASKDSGIYQKTFSFLEKLFAII